MTVQISNRVGMRVRLRPRKSKYVFLTRDLRNIIQIISSSAVLKEMREGVKNSLQIEPSLRGCLVGLKSSDK